MTLTNASARTHSEPCANSEVRRKAASSAADKPHVSITGSDGSLQGKWALPCLLLMALLVMAGCDDRKPQLVAARFMDEVVENGVPDQGESILLTFSAQIELVPRTNGDLHSGVVVSPTTDKLGQYNIVRGTEPTQIRVVLERGEPNFSARGARGTKEPTQIQIDFDELASVATVLNEAGEELTGSSNSVPIAFQRHPPTQLIAAKWRDSDGNYCVNQGDKLLVEFDRDVKLGDEIKRGGNAVPESLFWIPGNGIDRFDDGSEVSTLEQTTDSQVLAITLGAQPHLMVGGVFDPSRHAEFAPPSGLGINGTEIRPQRAILDSFDNGVCSQHFVDIEEESPCEPFSIATPFDTADCFRVGHTITPLPDGSVLVAGGGNALPDDSDGPIGDCWLRTPNGEWRGPIILKHPRQWHSATYFVGRDGEEGTADDAVILIGGHNGERALGSIEVVLPYAPLYVDDPYDLPLALPAQPKPVEMTTRYFHTAHLIRERNETGEARARIVLVGGFLAGGLREELNASIEEIILDVSWPEGAIEPEISSPPEWRSLGTLDFPRTDHASVVVDTELGERVVVYGGWGQQIEIGHGDRSVLSHVEVIDVDAGGSQLLNARLPARRDHALVATGEESSFFIIGGVKNKPYVETHKSSEESVAILRLTLEPTRTKDDEKSGAPEFNVVSEHAGELSRPRHSCGIAALPSGEILIIGGNEEGNETDRVELYEPELMRTSSLCRGLIVPRVGCQVAPAAGNSWVIVGGETDESVTPGQSIEVLYWHER